MLADRHLIDKHSDRPYVSVSPTIDALSIFWWKVLHCSIYWLIFILMVVRSMLVSQSEITQFYSSLNIFLFTLAIITFSNLTSACTIPCWCMYFRACSNCLMTSIIYFSLKIPKRCLRANKESYANSMTILICVSVW